MLDKEIYLTKDGLAKMENEVDELKTVKRREAVERIKDALDF